jgi:hypothetical protein
MRGLDGLREALHLEVHPDADSRMLFCHRSSNCRYAAPTGMADEWSGPAVGQLTVPVAVPVAIAEPIE